MIALEVKRPPIEINQQHRCGEVLNHGLDLAEDSPRRERGVEIGDCFSLHDDVGSQNIITHLSYHQSAQLHYCLFIVSP